LTDFQARTKSAEPGARSRLAPLSKIYSATECAVEDFPTERQQRNRARSVDGFRHRGIMPVIRRSTARLQRGERLRPGP
jgi:hypothetical protein